MFKPNLLFDWFAAIAMGVLAVCLFIAPYFGSVIANIGRRPVVLKAARGRTHRAVHHAQGSTAH